MKTQNIILGVVAMLLCYTPPAFACRFQSRSLSDNLAAASVVFVGKADHAEGDRSTGTFSNFTILLPIKGAEHSSGYTVTSAASSCGIDIGTGETWLIFGQRAHVGVETGQPSGSLLLSDATGHPVCESWQAVLALDKKAATIMPKECR